MKISKSNGTTDTKTTFAVPMQSNKQNCPSRMRKTFYIVNTNSTARSRLALLHKCFQRHQFMCHAHKESDNPAVRYTTCKMYQKGPHIVFYMNTPENKVLSGPPSPHKKNLYITYTYRFLQWKVKLQVIWLHYHSGSNHKKTPTYQNVCITLPFSLSCSDTYKRVKNIRNMVH